jgi:hypothetical protein
MPDVTVPQEAVWFVGVVGVLVLAASLLVLFGANPNGYESAVTNTLLPLFEASVAGLVSYTVGKALAAALKKN